MDDRDTRQALLRILQEQREDARRALAHSLRGKTCPIQRPNFKG